MNKDQAEHILDGYLLIWTNPNMEDAAHSLREIILDAMTSCKTSYVSTYPSITLPANTGTGYPTKPIVTCNGGVEWESTSSSGLSAASSV